MEALGAAIEKEAHALEAKGQESEYRDGIPATAREQLSSTGASARSKREKNESTKQSRELGDTSREIEEQEEDDDNEDKQPPWRTSGDFQTTITAEVQAQLNSLALSARSARGQSRSKDNRLYTAAQDMKDEEGIEPQSDAEFDE